MKKNLVFNIVIILIIVSCNNNNNNKTVIEDDSIPIKIGIAEKKEYKKILEYSGTFFAFKEANLGTSMPGKVEKFYFRKGSFVKQGTLLAELSSELLTQAIIEFDAIKKDYERIARLRDKGSISEMEYDHVKAKLDASQVKTEMLKKNTSIIAPFDGIIADYLIEEGENYFFTINYEPGYSNTSGIIKLMQINPLKFEINVQENDLNKIKLNQIVRVTCEAASLKDIQAKITFIEPYLSTTTRTAKVEITVPNFENKIYPGMYGKTYIDYGTEPGIYVKTNAVYRQPGTPDDFIFVIKNNKASKIKIKKIKSEGEYVVVEGINPGDTVALEGKNRLVDGSKVRIIN